MSYRKRTQSGMSVVEVAVASIGVVVLALAMASSTETVSSAWDTSVSTGQAQGHVHSALDAIVAELEDADIATVPDPLAPPLGSDRISFRSRIGFVDGAPELGPATVVFWEADPEDPSDNFDNDQDGLVDEGRVVRQDEANPAVRVVLADRVPFFFKGEIGNSLDDNGNGLEDERGFALDLVDGQLRIRLTVVRMNAAGELVQHAGATAIELR